MNPVTANDLLPFVWPMSFVLITLFLMRKVGNDIQPVMRGVVDGVAKNAKQYALMYAMAAIYASAASLQALGEVATSFGWVYVAAIAKVLQPGIVAVIAYVTKPPSFTQAIDKPNGTNPPIPT